MTTYVDHARLRYRGWLMSHLVADSPEELEDMARRLELREEWGQGSHYDVTESKRAAAIRLGARAVTTRQLIRILRAHR